MNHGSIGLRSGAATAAAMLFLLANQAVAGERGFYLAVDLGASDFDVSKADLDAVVDGIFEGQFTREDSDYNKQAIGAGFVAGYRFSPYFAAEVSLQALGKAQYDADLTDDNSGDEVSLGLDVESSGPAVVLVGSYPFTPAFSLDARAGVFSSKTKLTFSASSDGNSESESESDTDTALLFGIGGTWSFNPRMALRFGVTLFKDALGGEDDVTQASAGFQYTFSARR